MHRILFVCLGNICRSTMAQFVMTDLVSRAGRADEFVIDSAGTSDEERGNPPHHGTVSKLRSVGVPVLAHRARRVRAGEYGNWDLVVYMDEDNGWSLNRIFSGDPDHKCAKLLSYVPEDSPLRPRARLRDGSVRDVADPWWTGNFDDTYRDVRAGCEALLEALRWARGLRPELTRRTITPRTNARHAACPCNDGGFTMQFSKRLDRFGDEVFASLNARRTELEAAGREVIDLSVGTPDFEPPAHVKNALIEAAKDSNNWKYALHDLPELTQAVIDYYADRFGVTGLTPDMIMSCNGTQEGMGRLSSALVDEGDLVLVPDPCYPLFRASALIAGAELAFYPLNAENNFLPNVAEIPDEVADRAKYMIVSLPANPVGSVGTPEVYAQIIEFAKAHDVLIVHDNAYSDIIYDGVEGHSFFENPGASEVGVEFFSLSKSFDVTGARISFLVGRPDVVAAVRKIRSQSDYGMFLPIQHAAIAALTGPRDSVHEQELKYQERRDALCDGLERIGWERPNAHGSMFVWARLPHGRMDSVAFCSELMEKAGVIVTPGASFGPAGEGFVRMALVLPPDGLRRAVEAIEAANL